VKALTLQQPWAWAVCHASKRCENRAWLGAPGLLAQARSLVSQRFAVHAAAGTGTRAAAHAAALDVICIVGPTCDAFVSAGGRWLPAPELPRGAIVATARLAEVRHIVDNDAHIEIVGPDGKVHYRRPVGDPMGDEARARPGYRVIERAADPWAIPGTVGLLLADVRVLPVPVPCKGAQGWWTVPEGVEVSQ